MKRIKAINGYTIYQATARDESKYDVCEGYFYLYFSSDIRDYGLTNCDWDMETGTIEQAEAFAASTNYAVAKEIVEETTTAASFEEIAEVEAKLDNGMSREDIESEDEEDEEDEALNQKMGERKVMSLYDFLLFFDEDDNGQHRYVVAYSEEEATEKLAKHFLSLSKEGYQTPIFVCNPIVEVEGVVA